MAEPYAIARNPAPIPVDERLPLPLDPLTGYLAVAATVVPSPPTPVSIIYETAAGIGPPPAGFETSSVIPVGASLLNIIAMLSPAAAVGYFIQVFLGVAPPGVGATPFLVGDIATAPGGNTQFTPQEEMTRASGFIVVVSTTQSYYTAAPANLLRTVALGR